MVPNRRTGLAPRDNFRVARGVRIRDVAIEATSDDLPLENYHRADGNFSRFQRPLRRPQRLLHPQFVCLKLVHRMLVNVWIRVHDDFPSRDSNSSSDSTLGAPLPLYAPATSNSIPCIPTAVAPR